MIFWNWGGPAVRWGSGGWRWFCYQTGFLWRLPAAYRLVEAADGGPTCPKFYIFAILGTLAESMPHGARKIR